MKNIYNKISVGIYIRTCYITVFFTNIKFVGS